MVQTFAVIIPVTVTVLLIWLAWRAGDLLLMLFLATVIAVFFNRLARLVVRWTGLAYGRAFSLATIGILAFLSSAFYFFGQGLAHELLLLKTQLPEALAQAQRVLSNSNWGRWIIDTMPDPGQLGKSAVGWAPNALSGTAGVIGNTLFVLFTALFIGASPSVYRHGFLHLVPLGRRARVAEVLDRLEESLWKWFLGRLIAMTFIGLSISLGLLALQVPLPFGLGLVAGLLDFIPFIGPLIAAIPAVVLALSVDPTKALYVIALYLVMQNVQSYVVDPFIQQQAVDIPPGLLIAAASLGFLLFGILGMLVAAPLLVALMVVIKMLYVQDVLHDPIDLN